MQGRKTSVGYRLQGAQCLQKGIEQEDPSRVQAAGGDVFTKGMGQEDPSRVQAAGRNVFTGKAHGRKGQMGYRVQEAAFT